MPWLRISGPAKRGGDGRRRVILPGHRRASRRSGLGDLVLGAAYLGGGRLAALGIAPPWRLQVYALAGIPDASPDLGWRNSFP